MTIMKNVWLWGHNLAEYRDMFALTDEDLKKTILSYAGGPSSFNVELTEQGGRTIAASKFFNLSKDDLQKTIEKKFDSMLVQVKENADHFIWNDKIKSPEDLAKIRHHSLDLFLADYEQGLQDGRYIHLTPPELPFVTQQFQLALSSHFFFIANDDLDFHIQAMVEICRVAEELRIFPLLDYDGGIPELLGPLMIALQEHDLGVEVKQVPYQFQNSGNAMLRLWNRKCEV